MRLADLITERWDESNPLENTPNPLSWWSPHEVDMLKRYGEVKTAPHIDHYDAAMLIGANEQIFDVIDTYKAINSPITGEAASSLISIIKRITPFDKTFYRGVGTESYDDDHPMQVQSWSTLPNVARHFGKYIFKTIGDVQGVEISNIYYWHGLLYGGATGLGDIQAEWLLLSPQKTLVNG